MKNKRYELEVFIKTAYNIVKKYGFENLTVRRLSTYLRISSGPIYIQFKNIQEIKDEVVIMIFEKMIKESESKPFYESVIAYYPVQIIMFGLSHPLLFEAGWKDDRGNPKLMYELFEKFLLTYGITTGDFREMNLQDKRKYIQKVVMSMLGLFDTIHILNITDKQEIAKMCMNLLSRF